VVSVADEHFIDYLAKPTIEPGLHVPRACLVRYPLQISVRIPDDIRDSARSLVLRTAGSGGTDRRPDGPASSPFLTEISRTAFALIPIIAVRTSQTSQWLTSSATRRAPFRQKNAKGERGIKRPCADHRRGPITCGEAWPNAGRTAANPVNDPGHQVSGNRRSIETRRRRSSGKGHDSDDHPP
jgi:hypothetical protein